MFRSATMFFPVFVLIAMVALSHVAHVVHAGGFCGLVRENVLARGEIISIVDKAPSDNSYFCCNKCYEVSSCVGYVESGVRAPASGDPKARCTLLRSVQALKTQPQGGEKYYNTVLMTGRSAA